METLTCEKLSYAAAFSGSVTAVVVSAGSSTRMGGLNKQFVPILGIPTIVRSIKAFDIDLVKNIVVVAKKEDILKVEQLIDMYHLNKVSDIVEGGGTRQQSVLLGLERAKDSDFVLIHDGARPLVSDSLIGRVIDAFCEYDAVAPVLKVTDTLKEVDDKGTIIKTVDRERLAAVQTPQGFRLETYLEAAKGRSVDGLTDDCSLMEQAGISVHKVEGDPKNIKITLPEDIYFAETILKGGMSDYNF